MPRPKAPPTPASSTDIRAKDGYHAGDALSLPPTGYQEHDDRTTTSSTTPSAAGSDSSHSSYRPTSPLHVVGRQRMAPGGGSVISKDDFALPPPPTRSRKIIQMKPKGSAQEAPSAAEVSKAASAGDTRSAAKAGSKRKSATAGTTAAGRKIARKTAHSLIERRRRSKMNEEFGVLKEMIPACQGQEMHKLAILQASIEYLRYLEQCVAELKTQTTTPRSRRSAPPPPMHPPRVETIGDDDGDVDEPMEDDVHDVSPLTRATVSSVARSTSIVSLPSLSQMTSTSPSIFSVGAGKHHSVSSAASSYSPYFHSPASELQFHHAAPPPPPASFGNNTFGLGSPALKPVDSHLRQIAEGATELSADAQRLAAAHGSRSDHELDQEATTALLMLNHDRRNWREPGPSRSVTGMSVRDLLGN